MIRFAFLCLGDTFYGNGNRSLLGELHGIVRKIDQDLFQAQGSTDKRTGYLAGYGTRYL